MPRIPVYDQQQLASSVVGTPGEDKSGQIIAQGLEQGASAVQSAAFSGVTQDYNATQYAIRQKQAELKKVNDAIAKANMDTNVAAAAMDHKVKLQSMVNDITERYKNMPEGGSTGLQNADGSEQKNPLEDFNTASDKMRDEVLAGASDPLYRAKLEKALLSEKSNGMTALTSWQKSQASVVRKAQLVGMAGGLAQTVADQNTPLEEKTKTLQAYAQKNVGLYDFEHGADNGPVQLKKDIATAISADMEAVAAQGNPGALEARYKYWQSTGLYLDPAKANHVLAQQRTLENAQAHENKLNQDIESNVFRTTVEDISLSADDKDIDSLKAAREKAKAAYALIKNKPAEQRRTGDLEAAASTVKSLDSKIEQYPKKTRAEAKQAAQDLKDARFKAPESARARVQLIDMRGEIANNLINKKYDKATGNDKMVEFNHILSQARNNGSITEQAFLEHRKWLVDNWNKFQTVAKGEWKSTDNAMYTHAQQASKQFQQVPPHPGETTHQATDRRNAAYDAAFKANLAAFKRTHNNAEPTESQLKILHKMSMNGVRDSGH